MTTNSEPRQDVYARITTSIVAALEQGARPWVRPWSADYAAGRMTRPLRHNGQPYSGINVLSLWASALAQGFSAPIWMTYRQAAELGAHVRKGEKGSPVVYTNTLSRPANENGDSDDADETVRFLKGYTVFNVEQIDGLSAPFYAPATPPADPPARIAGAEAFFTATGAAISHGGSRAFYRPSSDCIVMPPFEAFRDAESYYATLAHETVHWTAHGSRLDRDFSRSESGGKASGKRFGSKAYAVEELVAELGAAFLCADLALAPAGEGDADAGAAHLAHHASYIANWLTVLRNDHRAVFTAAGHAQRAADWLNAIAATRAAA